MPFSERVSTDSSSVPVSAPGVTVLLFQALCKNVQTEVETEHQGEGLGLKECRDVALRFQRAAPNPDWAGLGRMAAMGIGQLSGCFSDSH